MKNSNVKETIIILIVGLIISILIVAVYISINKKHNAIKNDSNRFVYNNIEYEEPNGYKFMTINNDFAIIYSTNNWLGKIKIHNNSQIKNVNDLYNQVINSHNTIDFELVKSKVNKFDVLIYKYKENKELIVDFFTSMGNLYEIYLYYETNEFDLNDLSPVIESLNNPINLDEILKSTTTSVTQ